MAILAFLTSRVGMYLIIAVVAGGFLFGVRQSGYNAAMRKCEAAALKAKLQAQQVDLDAATNAAADKDRELNASNARLAEAERRIADVKNRNVPGCLADDDDVRLRGGAGRGAR